MEDHERYLKPYQKEINNMTLDFKKSRVVKGTPAKTIVTKEIKTNIVNQQDNYFNSTVFGNDEFFRNPYPIEIETALNQ